MASPHPAFGELVRLSLEDTGAYTTRLVLSGREALSVCAHSTFDLAVIDADLRDEPFTAMVRVITEQIPEIKLVIFPPDNDPRHPQLMGLRPHAYLEKPFYLPDLLSKVAQLLNPQPAALPEIPTITPAPQPAVPSTVLDTAVRQDNRLPWLQDVDLAAQHLTSLLLETNAQAAVIVRDGWIWSYAGHLLQPDVQILAETVNRYWDKYKKTDLARYMRLESGEYLTYATFLVNDLVLAMAFEIGMPLTRIRAQAGRLARALATPPAHPLEAPAPSEPEEELIGPALTEEEKNAILALLADMPSPDPDQDADMKGEWLPEPDLPAWAHDTPTLPAPPLADPENEQTRPTLIPGAISLPGKVTDLDPASHAVSLITYTGVLIPRMEEHYLTGELGILLAQWMPELCVAFGWRLDGISVRPDYFMWTVRVLPAVSPGNMVRILRQQTSQRVFRAKPTLQGQNPSHDFWAPGYLIISGSQMPSTELLTDYIEQTRRRQGAASRRNKKGQPPHATDPIPD